MTVTNLLLNQLIARQMKFINILTSIIQWLVV